MAINFKSPATSENLNNAFLDKNTDTETVFKIALKSPTSGSNVLDVQQTINNNIAGISQNASDILQNTSDITQNASDIAQNASDLSGHIAEYTAHEKRDTKANLDTWAVGQPNGANAYATDLNKKYYVVSDALVEVGTSAPSGTTYDKLVISAFSDESTFVDGTATIKGGIFSTTSTATGMEIFVNKTSQIVLSGTVRITASNNYAVLEVQEDGITIARAGETNSAAAANYVYNLSVQFEAVSGSTYKLKLTPAFDDDSVYKLSLLAIA